MKGVMSYNICDYGAVGDGKTDCTAAIQNAVNDCGQQGGGTVLIPAGSFATDMITLRDHVELHFESGSRLLSLLTPVPDPRAGNWQEPSANPRRWLIGGEKLSNVSITGFGTIEGQAEIHFWNKNDGLDHPLYGQRFWPRLHRPKGMIHFRECQDVVVRDVTLIDPPCYCLWLLGCDRCELHGIRVRADLRGPNDDGLDVDCCSNVRISDCDIICGDDGIAIKSDIHELGYDKPCENITITNCRMHTTSDGIRLGYEGDGAIRRIAVSNCVIHDTMIGISIMSAISPYDRRGTVICKGPEITDVVFENMVIHAFQTFNFQHPKNPKDCPDPIRGFMDRIFFRNITASATRGSFLGGVPESPIRHIEFSNLHLTLSGEMGTDFLSQVPDPYPVWSDLPFSGIPYPFYVRNARDVVIRDSTVVWENATGAWQAEIARRENAAVTVERVRTVNPPGPRPDEVIFPIGMYCGVPYFMPPEGFDESTAMKALYEVNDANAFTLGKLPEAKRTPVTRITASFVYAQPPDYHGLPMLYASVPIWREVFLRFRKMHIVSVIFQAALWQELGACFYRSQAFSSMKCYGVLERMMEAAEAENIQVYLGGYGSVTGWKEHFSETEMKAELECHRKCFEEISRIGRIRGMYFPAETAFSGRRQPEKEKRMNFLYRYFSDMVKGHDPSLRIITSPATRYIPDKMELFQEFWASILKNSNIDILMPQDSIGTGKNRIAAMDSQWKAWKSVADCQGIDLWSHTEIFERRGYRPEHNLYPASPERVAAQLALTEPYVSRHCCWEALYFTSDDAGPEAVRLRKFMEN